MAKKIKNEGDDPAAKEKAEGMIAARNHDEINLVLVSALMAMTLYTFFFHQIYDDALNARLHTIDTDNTSPQNDNENTFINQEDHYYNNKNRIYFWLENRTEKLPVSWEEPSIYFYLTVAALMYTTFDTLYLLLVPACTTKAWTLIPHHLATLCLTSGAMYLNVKPLTVQCLLVEVNTLILTLKNIKRSPNVNINPVSNFMRWLGVTIHDMFSLVIHPCFLASWIFLRLFFYPYILLTFHRYFDHARFGLGGYLYVMISLSTLNVLNYHWTMGGMGFLFTFGMLALCLLALWYM